ncbi:MAG TPA: hypothetical protein VF707_05430 [Ardenticatenaceae bacterium]|jgi:hypothetical protein
MSVTIQYFFNSPKDPEELGRDINNCLGCSLAPYEGDPEDLFDRFLSMEFTLQIADEYVNDKELDLENFGYYLDFRTPVGDADARAIQVPAMLMVIFALHRCFGITGILVFDVQILLARYEERAISGYGKRLYDLVSDTVFLSFPAHLNAIGARLPDKWRKTFMEMPS